MHNKQTPCDFLRALCEMPSRGGRVVPCNADHSALDLLDVPEWTDAMQHSTEARFPNASISIRACPQSLSGFAVRVRIHDHDMWSIFITAGAVALMGAITAFCLGWIQPHVAAS